MNAELQALATAWPCALMGDDPELRAGPHPSVCLAGGDWVEEDIAADWAHPDACLVDLDPGERPDQGADAPRSPTSCPIVEELTGVEPWRAFLALHGLEHVVFFDSAMAHPELGRYSYLAADPFDWLGARRGRIRDQLGRLADTDPFAVLAERLARFRAETLPGLPPFQGGLAGLFGYDLCHHLERLPRPGVDEFQVPDLAVGLYDWVLAFDHVENRAWLISTGFPEREPARRRRRAEQRLQFVRARLHAAAAARGNAPNAPAIAPQRSFPVHGQPGLFSNFKRADYLQAVRRAVDYVHAGDCFQVNLAQRLLARQERGALDIFARLRERNAATFAGYLDMGDFVLASASPERFLRLDAGEVETRPIKGTRPRGRSFSEDECLTQELLASAKDRAENTMIVDLLRNDLGRVCQYGSIRVPALCRLESYAFVHHLVSEVRGKLRDGLTGIDLLRAAFPGGSVTGAPKIRAMEIIAELEGTARGAYCGSLGFLGFDGAMDTNILIRTFTIGQGWVQFPVGGGIVADSQPEQEYAETWHKAAGLLEALR
ncbi:MAG: aminodeoxychorismate synthase component I [Gemmataceae bacterium]